MKKMIALVLGVMIALQFAAMAGETRPLPVKGLNETLDEVARTQEEKAKLVDEANKRK